MATPPPRPSPARLLRWLLPALLLALLVGALATWVVTRPTPAERRTTHAIHALLELRRAHAAHVRDSLERAVLRFYDERRDRPAWSDGRHPGEAAATCAVAFAAAAREGLDPADYGGTVTREACARLMRDVPAAPPESLAALDLRMTRAFLRYARDERRGRLPDSALDAHWVAARAPWDPLADLNEAIRHGHTRRLLMSLGPQDPESRALRDALRWTLDAAARGGWPPLGTEASLRRGDAGPAVARLRRRLACEETVDTSLGGAPFDRALEAAVRAYQQRRGLKPTGIVDGPTRAALGVPARERARTLALNLERRRWLPLPPPEPCITVNIPDFSLEVHDSSRVVMRMRTVVGERQNPTPVFSAAVSYLQFNPTWRVPKRIVVTEIVPAMKRDTSYLAKNHMRVFDTHAPKLLEVPHTSVDWSIAEQDTFHYLVVQDAGDDNPLGRIKFMCPNPYDVYLHDTSTRWMFAEWDRARSHGCVRVQLPHELAERLLAAKFQAAARDTIDTLLVDRVQRQIGLPARIPVHVLYWTAWVDSAGAVEYRDDLYGIDERLAEALHRPRHTGFVLNPPIEWGELHRGEKATETRAP